MSDALARMRRLRPDVVGEDRYRGHHSHPRHDPEARAALIHVLHHLEIHADRFWRRDVIEAAMRVAAPDVTLLRIGADLQRLVLGRGAVQIVRRPGDPRDGTGQKLTTTTAGAISGVIAWEIDEALGEDVFLMAHDEALARLAAGPGRRHVVLAPDRRAACDLAARHDVHAIPVRRWIALMDRALVELENPEPLWRYWNRRTLLVDRAWTLPNIDVLLILELCRRLCLDLVLVDDVDRFPIGGAPFELVYTRRMGQISAPRPVRQTRPR